MITIRDWRTLAPDEAAPLYEAERARSRAELEWDTAGTWRAVESARGMRALPGLVALDERGAMAGWTFFLLHGSTLQVGAIESATGEATEALVRGVLASPEAAAADRVMAFGINDAVGLDQVLAAAGFEAEPYTYMCAPLRRGLAPSAESRPWRPGDRQALSDLLQEAYPGADESRPFAPSGDAGAWREYVSQLIDTAGCGTFLGSVSRVVQASGGLDGVALVSHLSGTTAHLLQLAVAPRAQGQRLGRSLLTSSMAAASALGLDRMTLLVRDRNAPARRLYASLGFVARARFVSASLDVSARAVAA